MPLRVLSLDVVVVAFIERPVESQAFTVTRRPPLDIATDVLQDFTVPVKALDVPST